VAKKSKKKRTRVPGLKKGEGLTKEQHAFLAALPEAFGVIVTAAEAAGVDRRCHSNWIKNPEYREAFEEAFEAGTQKLEAAAIERASRKAKPSDILLIFMLKARRPDVYRDNVKHEHTGKIDLPVFVIEVEKGADDAAD
jgi:hypothetical protein